MPLKIRIGSRPSKLALAQAAIVRDRLVAQDPAIKIEIVEIHTSGDKMTSASLADIGGKGLFIKELEQALADGKVDIAVHSMKDLPAVLPPQFRLAAVPVRENTADILVTRDGSTLSALAAGARVGTSSTRRKFQALRVNPALDVQPLRGNVDTRLAREADGTFDAVIIAMAGVKRLGRVNDLKFVELDARDFISSGGQGALAIETLADRKADELDRALAAINDARAFYETAAERAFLAALGASCTTPVGVRARLDGDQLGLAAMLFSPDGSRELSDAIVEARDPKLAPSAAENSGRRFAEVMIERGADAMLGKERIA
ncbi:MAG TPA: hydroxymethylbilane synthase [Patescibacteria group bacterium]|nr:hydroxymethylbilane synthase [Patescibacteria group bacterium]